jgi:hypothetical protein
LKASSLSSLVLSKRRGICSVATATASWLEVEVLFEKDLISILICDMAAMTKMGALSSGLTL